MIAGAVLILESSSSFGSGQYGDLSGGSFGLQRISANPIACIEVLGQSVLERTIQMLHRAGIAAVTVVANENLSPLLSAQATRQIDVTLVRRLGDLRFAAECILREYAEQGVETGFVLEIGPYFEFDFADLLQFHKSKNKSLTALTDPQGELRSWVIPADRVRETPRMGLASLMDARNVSQVEHYSVPGYVNRLENGGDLRRLIRDAFFSRCAIYPSGHELKPGVWLDEGAQVHPMARIVAPAYVGRGTRVSAGAVITRGSDVESGCRVESGSVVENSSILANTYVGRNLDVAHAVISGNMLLHVLQNAVMEISDSRLLGPTVPPERPRTSAGISSGASLGERLLAAWGQTAL
jgi:NDP-sugar pyrophosphorylase family protein